jgi:glycosyl transferase family 25
MKLVTYLINLDGSERRLAHATAQLDQQGLQFERYAAFDGRATALTEFSDYDDQLSQKRLGRSLLNSEIGCFYSHLGCVKKFLLSDADYLLVLEDDLQIVPDFKQSIDQILAYLHQHPEIEWYLMNIAAKKKKFAQDIGQLNGHSLWHAYYFPIRGLGLIWSRRGAEQFLQQAQCISLPVDILFQTWLCRQGKGLGVWPALVKPSGFDSDILGTVATQGIARKHKEKRQWNYGLKKQQRMWLDRCYALQHLLAGRIRK